MHINQIDNDKIGMFGGAHIVSEPKVNQGAAITIGNSKTDESKITPADYLKQVTYDKKQKGQATAEDIMAMASGLDAVQMKNAMVTGANTITNEDAKKVEEDGFSLHDTDIKTVVTVTDKIQAELAKAGADTSYYTSDLSKAQLEEMGITVAAMEQFKNQMTANDLPLTKDNIDQFESNLNQIQSISELNSGSIKYLLANNLEPTAANIYNAAHNGASGYVAPVNEAIKNDQAMVDAVSLVINAAGLEANSDNIDSALWMSANNIDITAENIRYNNALNNLHLPMEAAGISDYIANTVTELANGGSISNVSIIGEYSTNSVAKAVCDVIANATDEDLAYIVDQGLPLNIENLREARNLAENGKISAKLNGDYTDGGLSIVRARRALEEARLLMTTEANLKLIKSGINVDIRPIEKLVEDLKAQENSYYKDLLGGDVASDSAGQTSFAAKLDDAAKLFSNVIEVAESLKSVPAYVLGTHDPSDSIQVLHDAGKSLEAKMNAAGEAYETMQTEVRKDLGDSIKKAFQNVDDILDDIGMEKNTSNERAVRILAYNRLEINTASVTQMKQADLAVQKAFDSLKPATVREMIKEGINPLNMNIEELNKKASEISKEIGADKHDERYAEYLYKLDARNQISPEERESFIGIYRLINQVEASDGAAIGALVAQGSDITMGKLLSAVRSSKKGSMDYKVDDDFGGVDRIDKGTSITAQINAAYQMECFTAIQKTAKSPEQFEDFLKGENKTDWQNLTPEQFLEHINNVDISTDGEIENRYYGQILAEMEECAATDEQFYRMLDQNDLPASIDNVLAMQQMMRQPNQAFRKIFDMDTSVEDERGELLEELKNIKTEIYEKFGEDVEAPEEYAKALDTLYEVAEHCMQTVMYDKGMTNLDLRQLQLATKQLMIGAKVARNEHYRIPVETENGVVAMDVKVVRGSGENGKIDFSMDSPEYGNVRAEIVAKENGNNGYIVTDSRAGYEALMAMSDEINARLGGEISIQFAARVDRNVSASAVNQRGEASSDDTYKVQTSKLYGLAKKLMTILK